MSFLGTAGTIAAGVLGTPVAGEAFDQAFNNGNVTKTIAGGVGDAANAYIDVGKNGYQATPADVLYPQYGGYNNGAHDMSLLGQQGMGTYNGYSGNLYGQAQDALSAAGYGASEDPTLAGNEAYSRGYDQSGAMQLDQEAAMGMAPSAAASQMQNGLNQAIANQYAVAGGARGNAGIALAQGNAGANIANLQNQAYTAAGQQRAAEMAQARGAYNSDAQNMRAQDQSRLQMGNQMGQFNVQNAQQTAQQALAASQGYGNLANSFYGNSQNPYNSQLQGDTASANNYAQASMNAQNLNAGVAQTNANNKKDQVNTGIDTIGGFVKSAGGGVGGSMPKA